MAKQVPLGFAFKPKSVPFEKAAHAFEVPSPVLLGGTFQHDQSKGDCDYLCIEAGSRRRRDATPSPIKSMTLRFGRRAGGPRRPCPLPFTEMTTAGFVGASPPDPTLVAICWAPSLMRCGQPD
jgi:hypothetical protein